MRSAEGAIDWMRNQHAIGATGWQGWCLRASRTAWGLPGGWNSANDWWAAVPAAHRHSWSTAPPLGAPVFWAGGNHGHIELSDGRGGIWGTDSPTRDRIGNVNINWPRDRWGFRNVGWASWLNGSVLPLNMGGGSTPPGGGGSTTPSTPEAQMDGFAEVTRSARQRIGTDWTWLTFNRNVRNTADVHFRDGIFSVASRRFDIDLSATFATEARARVSVQLMLVDQSNVARGSYPVQSFDVGGGMTQARFAGLSGFCPAQQRARIRVRSLDGPVEVMPFAVVKRWR